MRSSWALQPALPQSISLFRVVGFVIATSVWSNMAVADAAASDLLSAPPISMKHGLNKFWSQRWQKAQSLAELEQQVSDYNADWIAGSGSAAQAVRHRRLLVLPLDDGFDPPMGVFSHQHIQTGDKMSLPKNFWQAIQLNAAEVPWLFSIKRIDGVTSPRVEFDVKDDEITPYRPLKNLDEITPYRPLKNLDQGVGGPLDFRAPSCYVFVPMWMMRALGLHPRDVVQVDLHTTVAPGALAKLRPHSKRFAHDIANPQAVLETELRHYSALTAGSTISVNYNKQRYWLDVVELRSAPRGEKAPMIKVQDCDIATDFLISKEEMVERKKERQRRMQDKEV